MAFVATGDIQKDVVNLYSMIADASSFSFLLNKKAGDTADAYKVVLLDKLYEIRTKVDELRVGFYKALAPLEALIYDAKAEAQSQSQPNNEIALTFEEVSETAGNC